MVIVSLMFLTACFDINGMSVRYTTVSVYKLHQHHASVASFPGDRSPNTHHWVPPGGCANKYISTVIWTRSFCRPLSTTAARMPLLGCIFIISCYSGCDSSVGKVTGEVREVSPLSMLSTVQIIQRRWQTDQVWYWRENPCIRKTTVPMPLCPP